VRQEVQTQTARSGFADPRRKVRGEPNSGVRSQVPRPDFVDHRGPEEVPEERSVLQKRRPPRDDESHGGKEKFFVFRKRAPRSGRTFFLYGFGYRSAGDLACKQPVRSITSFFCCLLLYYLSFVSSSAAGYPFLFEFYFSFGKRGEG
jgi:hypothetical protein